MSKLYQDEGYQLIPIKVNYPDGTSQDQDGYFRLYESPLENGVKGDIIVTNDSLSQLAQNVASFDVQSTNYHVVETGVMGQPHGSDNWFKIK